jgi:hypothetical protein
MSPLSEELKGRVDYHLSPGLRAGWGGPFNGQAFRTEQFDAIVRVLRPVCLVETGTYLGRTTEYLATVGVPVFTFESDAHHHAFSAARFRGRPEVTLRRCDSRTGIAALLADGRIGGDGCVFFYLDAHWHEDLPLADELALIVGGCHRPVIMIDDFQVPHDPGYGYDDYGPGQALTPAYVAPLVSATGLRMLYPAAPAAEETGARRGSVVLCTPEAADPLLSTGVFRAA